MFSQSNVAMFHLKATWNRVITTAFVVFYSLSQSRRVAVCGSKANSKMREKYSELHNHFKSKEYGKVAFGTESVVSDDRA